MHVCGCDYLLYIRGSLGWGLHEYEAVFSGKCFTFLFLHLSPRLQVTKTHVDAMSNNGEHRDGEYGDFTKYIQEI